MLDNREFPFSTKLLLQGLPKERSLAEIRDKYRNLISECTQEYSRGCEDVLSMGLKGLSKLTISLAKDITSQFGRLIEWSDDLIPAFPVRPYAVMPLCSMRSVFPSETPPSDRRDSYEFQKRGDDCLAQICLEVKGSVLDMTVSLLDDETLPILPFSLTILDKETERILLDGKEFRNGAARLRGIERGEYRICCEQGTRKCDFALTVR